jgi:hypothetical protein
MIVNSDVDFTNGRGLIEATWMGEGGVRRKVGFASCSQVVVPSSSAFHADLSEE